ncbi:MAG: response regulator [bacterium]
MTKEKEVKQTIIIVDDHRLFRGGLKFILETINNVEVIAEASNGQECMDILKNYKPSLLLLDINMPVLNGVETTKKALDLYPDLKILVLTMFGDDVYYTTMINLGIRGFLLKDADNDEFKTAVQKVLSGGTFFSPSLLLKFIKEKSVHPPVEISKREKEVLGFICQGYSNYEISEKLFISHRTVERHRANLLQKTKSTNSINLVVYAIKHNLYKI